MNKFLKNLPWKRIATVALGALGVYESTGGVLPPWVAVAGGVVAGVAVNGEKYLAKRKKPSAPFDSDGAVTKVERMR